MPTSGRRRRRPRSIRNGRRWPRPGRHGSPPSRRGPVPSTPGPRAAPPSTVRRRLAPGARRAHRSPGRNRRGWRRCGGRSPRPWCGPCARPARSRPRPTWPRRGPPSRWRPTEARLAEIEAQSEARPEASRFRDAERDPAAGAPFYELVDLAAGGRVPTMPPAWRPRSRRPDCSTRGSAPKGSSSIPTPMTRCCTSAARPSRPVRPRWPTCWCRPPSTAARCVPQTVAALLRAVGLGDQPGVASWVSVGGRWALGVGAWRLAQGHGRVPRGGRPAGNP